MSKSMRKIQKTLAGRQQNEIKVSALHDNSELGSAESTYDESFFERRMNDIRSMFAKKTTEEEKTDAFIKAIDKANDDYAMYMYVKSNFNGKGSVAEHNKDTMNQGLRSCYINMGMYAMGASESGVSDNVIQSVLKKVSVGFGSVMSRFAGPRDKNGMIDFRPNKNDTWPQKIGKWCANRFLGDKLVAQGMQKVDEFNMPMTKDQAAATITAAQRRLYGDVVGKSIDDQRRSMAIFDRFVSDVRKNTFDADGNHVSVEDLDASIREHQNALLKRDPSFARMYNLNDGEFLLDDKSDDSILRLREMNNTDSLKVTGADFKKYMADRVIGDSDFKNIVDKDGYIKADAFDKMTRMSDANTAMVGAYINMMEVNRIISGDDTFSGNDSFKPTFNQFKDFLADYMLYGPVDLTDEKRLSVGRAVRIENEKKYPGLSASDYQQMDADMYAGVRDKDSVLLTMKDVPDTQEYFKRMYAEQKLDDWMKNQLSVVVQAGGGLTGKSLPDSTEKTGDYIHSLMGIQRAVSLGVNTMTTNDIYDIADDENANKTYQSFVSLMKGLSDDGFDVKTLFPSVDGKGNYRAGYASDIIQRNMTDFCSVTINPKDMSAYFKENADDYLPDVVSCPTWIGGPNAMRAVNEVTSERILKSDEFKSSYRSMLTDVAESRRESYADYVKQSQINDQMYVQDESGNYVPDKTSFNVAVGNLASLGREYIEASGDSARREYLKNEISDIYNSMTKSDRDAYDVFCEHADARLHSGDHKHKDAIDDVLQIDGTNIKIPFYNADFIDADNYRYVDMTKSLVTDAMRSRKDEGFNFMFNGEMDTDVVDSLGAAVDKFVHQRYVDNNGGNDRCSPSSSGSNTNTYTVESNSQRVEKSVLKKTEMELLRNGTIFVIPGKGFGSKENVVAAADAATYAHMTNGSVSHDSNLQNMPVNAAGSSVVHGGSDDIFNLSAEDSQYRYLGTICDLLRLEKVDQEDISSAYFDRVDKLMKQDDRWLYPVDTHGNRVFSSDGKRYDDACYALLTRVAEVMYDGRDVKDWADDQWRSGFGNIPAHSSLYDPKLSNKNIDDIKVQVNAIMDEKNYNGYKYNPDDFGS